MTRMCLELFLDFDENTPQDVIEEISDLATQHWHGNACYIYNFLKNNLDWWLIKARVT